MSLTSKVTFGACLGTTLGIIVYVHYKQQFDRDNMRQGVLKDIEQQQMKKMQNIYMMEQQKDLAAKYRNLDNTNK
jgi:hypothetical protein